MEYLKPPEGAVFWSCCKCQHGNNELLDHVCGSKNCEGDEYAYKNGVDGVRTMRRHHYQCSACQYVDKNWKHLGKCMMRVDNEGYPESSDGEVLMYEEYGEDKDEPDDDEGGLEREDEDRDPEQDEELVHDN